MSKQVSLLKRGISYIVDLYSGSLIGTLPISLMTYVQLGKMTQNAFLLVKIYSLSYYDYKYDFINILLCCYPNKNFKRANIRQKIDGYSCFV